MGVSVSGISLNILQTKGRFYYNDYNICMYICLHVPSCTSFTTTKYNWLNCVIYQTFSPQICVVMGMTSCGSMTACDGNDMWQPTLLNNVKFNYPWHKVTSILKWITCDFNLRYEPGSTFSKVWFGISKVNEAKQFNNHKL